MLFQPYTVTPAKSDIMGLLLQVQANGGRRGGRRR